MPGFALCQRGGGSAGKCVRTFKAGGGTLSYVFRLEGFRPRGEEPPPIAAGELQCGEFGPASILKSRMMFFPRIFSFSASKSPAIALIGRTVLGQVETASP
jgi:hypothetical protein